MESIEIRDDRPLTKQLRAAARSGKGAFLLMVRRWRCVAQCGRRRSNWCCRAGKYSCSTCQRLRVPPQHPHHPLSHPQNFKEVFENITPGGCRRLRLVHHRTAPVAVSHSVPHFTIPSHPPPSLRLPLSFPVQTPLPCARPSATRATSRTRPCVPSSLGCCPWRSGRRCGGRRGGQGPSPATPTRHCPNQARALAQRRLP